MALDVEGVRADGASAGGGPLRRMGPGVSQTAPSTAAGPLDAASAAATSFRNAALRFASPITSLASFSEPSLTSASSFGSPPLSDDHDRASLEGWVAKLNIHRMQFPIM